MAFSLLYFWHVDSRDDFTEGGSKRHFLWGGGSLLKVARFGWVVKWRYWPHQRSCTTCTSSCVSSLLRWVTVRVLVFNQATQANSA